MTAVKYAAWLSLPPRQISPCAVGQITFTTSPRSRPNKRDASRPSRNVGWECGGRAGIAGRAIPARTVKSCGPDVPTLISSRRRCYASWPVTETTKPGLRGEHEGNRKTIAQGMPDDGVVPVVTNSCVFLLAREAAGACRTRHSLRPLVLEDVTGPTARARFASRECRFVFSSLFDRLIGDRCAYSRVLGAMRRASAASQNRDPCQWERWAPPLRRITSCCATSAARGQLFP